MSKPVISILMPVYNGGRYLAPAVESLLAQTFGDFELLIADDGSTDGSADVLRGFARRDERIRLTVRENIGLTRTLNELFAQSSGEFIARMDGDDVALPHRFAVQLETLRADPGMVCVGGCFQLIDAEGRTLTVLEPPADDAEIQRQALAGHGSICHPTAMIRRAALTQIGGYCEDFRTAQDVDLWLRLGEVGRLGNVPQTVLQFRLHDGSVSERRGVEQRASGRMACERAWARRGIADGVFEADAPWRPGADSASRAKFALQYGWWAFLSGEHRTARHYARRAIGARPFDAAGWKLLACATVKRAKPA